MQFAPDCNQQVLKHMTHKEKRGFIFRIQQQYELLMLQTSKNIYTLIISNREVLRGLE